ncbi:MAG: hypothetical protein ABIH46_05025 [Chloroflexota bacterium]
MELKSGRFDVTDYFEWQELAFARRWTDGLPVSPPIESQVQRMVEFVGRDPQEVVGEIPPKHGLATIEKIAINSVMAGCLPDYMPVVVAAIKAMIEPEFNLNGIQDTTHPATPLTIVSGPIAERLEFNCKDGVFGGGSRANATIGRAIRLVLWNVGGAYPGDIDKAVFSHPGKYTYCIAENQSANPWEPLHVDRGLPASVSALTVIACEAPHHVAGRGNPLGKMLRCISDTMSALGSNNPTVMGQVLLVMSPLAAAAVAKAGWSKGDLKASLFEKARRRLGDIKEAARDLDLSRLLWPEWIDTTDDDYLVPIVQQPEDILITVAGGTGSNSLMVCPGWGGMGGYAVTKEIELPK